MFWIKIGLVDKQNESYDYVVVSSDDVIALKGDWPRVCAIYLKGIGWRQMVNRPEEIAGVLGWKYER